MKHLLTGAKDKKVHSLWKIVMAAGSDRTQETEPK